MMHHHKTSRQNLQLRSSRRSCSWTSASPVRGCPHLNWTTGRGGNWTLSVGRLMP